MALDPRELAKVIEIINNRDKGKENPPVKEYKGGKTPTPTGRTNEFNYAGGLQAYLSEAQKKGLDVSNVKSAKDLQERIYDSLMSSKEGKGVIRNMWSQYGDTMKGSGQVLPANMSDQDLTGLRSSFADDMLGGRTQMVLAGLSPKIPYNPPAEVPQESPYQDPRTPYTVQGRLPSGEETVYYPKNMQDWEQATSALGVQYQNQVRGNEGSQGAQANYYRGPVEIAAMMKNDPAKMAALGEAYVADPSNQGKNRFVKLMEAERSWNEGVKNKLMKSGFKGQELENALMKEMTRNPYRSR